MPVQRQPCSHPPGSARLHQGSRRRSARLVRRERVRGARSRARARPPAHSRHARTVTPRHQRMSYLLPHLRSGWAVDQAILAEEVRAAPSAHCHARCRGAVRQGALRARDSSHSPRVAQERVVVLRFGHDYEETCMQMDEVRAQPALVGAPRAMPPRCAVVPTRVGAPALTHAAGRSDARLHRRVGQELCRHLCGGYHRGARAAARCRCRAGAAPTLRVRAPSFRAPMRASVQCGALARDWRTTTLGAPDTHTHVAQPGAGLQHDVRAV